MSNKIISVIFLAITTICNAQSTSTKYYNNIYLEKEVAISKAKFSQTITQNTDSETTTEVKNIKKNEIITSETYKGNEPFGIWKYQDDNKVIELNYDFTLIYSDKPCVDSLKGVKKKFENNDSLKYIAPKIASGETTISAFISNNIIYPTKARDSGIIQVKHIYLLQLQKAAN